MKIRQKSPEELQAQAEFFADTGVKEFSDEQKLLLGNSARLSKITNLDELSDVPEELATVITENRKKYTEAIRNAPKDELEFRHANAELYNTSFRPVIERLKQNLASTDDPKALPEYLGSGSNGSAYIIEVNGKKYAAKFSRNLTQANFETKPLRQAKGIEHTAQLVAYSFDDSCVIMELLSGRDVTQIPPEEPIEYSDEHITQLIDTVLELHENGITIDPKPSNFMYDPEQGFNILDFHLSNGASSIGDIVMGLRLALTERDWPRLDYNADDYQEQADKQNIERNKIALPTMVRFLQILKTKYPEIVEDYWTEYNRREADPRCRQNPLIDRNYIPDHQDLKPHLAELERLGF